jgi:hypothetical protein
MPASLRVSLLQLHLLFFTTPKEKQKKQEFQISTECLYFKDYLEHVGKTI